jgi:hypothetical protein
MLHRDDPDGLIVIAQPAHAWVSGQLARAWGNATVGPVTPREAVCLGAEQHDVGWVEWEAAPTLNPATGRPHTFMEMPLAHHLALWSGAAGRALTQGRYAALLVSLHGTGLYQRRDLTADTPADAAAVRAFLERERAWQADLLATLRADPAWAAATAPATVTRNQRLVAVWDRLSLLLCMGLRAPRTIEGVPAAQGALTLTLTPRNGDPTRVRIDPWPFATTSVTVTVEGRRLPAPYDDEAALRSALAQAPWVTIETRLEPSTT